jgi:hypothetical protein
LELPVEQAESLIMTLPRLLACALRQRIQDARYVFGLGEWAVERAKGQACLIATLKTPDGFEVCFGIPFEACRSLRRNLLRAAQTHDSERTSHTFLRLSGVPANWDEFTQWQWMTIKDKPNRYPF